MHQTQQAISSLCLQSPVADFIDEPLEDSPAPPQRLAGVGAALGGCFGAMIVVLLISSAGTISGPRAGLAADGSGTATSPDQQPIGPSPAATETSNQLGGPAAGPVAQIEDRLRLQSLERAAMLARAEVQAAESRLALLHSEVERRALARAEQERARAEQIESDGSPYDWMTTEQLATRTRERARSQLDTDLNALRSLGTVEEEKMMRLRDAAVEAESALALARTEVLAQGRDLTPAAVESDHGNPTASSGNLPAATLDGDLRSLIARHHARLIEATSTASANQ